MGEQLVPFRGALLLSASATITLQKNNTDSLSDGGGCYLQQRLHHISFEEVTRGGFEVILNFFFHPKHKDQEGFHRSLDKGVTNITAGTQVLPNTR